MAQVFLEVQNLRRQNFHRMFLLEDLYVIYYLGKFRKDLKVKLMLGQLGDFVRRIQWWLACWLEGFVSYDPP